ncbi:MAG: M20 family metallopeptidase [Candidatus Omnitrophota bacterium]
MINKQRLIKLTQALIRINSENPGGNEFEIARFVKRYLERMGLEPKIYEFKKKRSNVVCVLKGKHAKYSLLITPHLDTVPRGNNWRFSPFAAKIQDGRIYGLGATDCKGNLAVALEAMNSLSEEEVALDYNLIFAATADEESGSFLGLLPLLEKGILKPDAALVLDSDDFNIIVAQKGLMQLKVKIEGKRAHGAYPWQGVNAVELAMDMLRELKQSKFSYEKNKYLRPPTMNIGTIKGGDKVNVVADWCEFELDFRFLPGTQARNLLKDIRKIMQKQTKKFKIEIEAIQAPFRIGKAHSLVIGLCRAMRQAKARPAITGSEGATVITFFQRRNIPALATGFGSAGTAHSADEYVKINNLYKGAYILEAFLKGARLWKELKFLKGRG